MGKFKVKLSFFIIISLIVITVIFSLLSGSIKISISELLQGIFGNYNIDYIVDLRIPRIAISLLAGAALGVSGLLLQTSLRNPLLDPSIIGISSGANLFLYIGLILMPNVIFYKSILSIMGGIFGYILIYICSKNMKSSVSVILVGIAINSFFTGVLILIQYLRNSTTSINIRATLGMKSFEDVKLLIFWVPIFIIITFMLYKICNIFFLSDRDILSLGINVQLIRTILSFLAIILASIATSVVGVVVFLSLIVPHISKIIIGKNHVVTIPFTALLGGFIFLLFDTLGRVLFSPIEIPADVIMLLVGGPTFLILLKKESNYG
ncbi:iron ABC transporter permease [Gemella sp. GH3]|uniref:FecCD family ABC transporter permease n=1 Tax=unclassified Gemella TaxID=2624949 RepID=UPI0015D09975|nr:MULTISPECIES: iron ABC transporter permease [unclassified Gemella]MBF0713967.1 iron ABC transporter permease [Gemella sp. GH3.1]NYS50919.1 iron ABC transporter permease [Gemella sp. GH3]